MNNLLFSAVEAAREAGRVIMEVYSKPFEVYTKDDDSPVTQADLRASRIIKELLKPTGILFVSEEDLPPDRSGFGRYWLVDPLDGTAEFVKRNGEFTVNIALIEERRPVLGVIYAPVTGGLWAAGKNGVARKSFLRHCISPCGRYDKVPFGVSLKAYSSFWAYLALSYFENITFSLLNIRVSTQTPKTVYSMLATMVITTGNNWASCAKTLDMVSTLL